MVKLPGMNLNLNKGLNLYEYMHSKLNPANWIHFDNPGEMECVIQINACS
jgi:hypothetical protein